jgi:hypothetical protein
MPEYLLVFDLDKIHEYVFATGRLKEIRGGSALMREITEEQAVLKLLGNFSPKKVYIGGGAGKVVIKANNDEHAREAADLLEKHVRERTVSGSLTAVVVPIRNDNFKASVDEGDWKLRRRKMDKAISLQLGMAPVTKFCQSCRSLPAINRMDDRDLCEACLRKRKKADALKEALPQGEFWQEDPLGKEFIRIIQECYSQHSDDWKQSDLVPEHLSELALLGFPENYIGFIHCDGNRMGEHLKSLDGTQDSYVYFSNLVNRAVYEAAAEALAEVYPEPRDGKMPFDVVLIGGDDLIIITTADGAMDVATKFCKKFQEKTKSEGHEVSMSAGVVLAHAHQPILQVQRRAKELLSSAKKFSKWKQKQENKEVGVIDFLVSSTSTLDSLSVLRAVEYEFEDRGIRYHLHRRPYTVEEMEILLNWVKKIKHGDPNQNIPPLPRNKLNDIYRIFFQSKQRMQIDFDLLTSLMRLRDRHREWLFKEIPDALLGASGQFWQIRRDPRTNQKECYTVFPDIAELYEFVR